MAKKKKETGFLYKQICAKLQKAIENKKWKPGERLPAIRELAEEYKCNYHTVRNALNLLMEKADTQSSLNTLLSSVYCG